LHVSYLYLVFIVQVPVEETAFYRHHLKSRIDAPQGTQA